MTHVRCNQGDGKRRRKPSQASFRRIIVGVHIDMGHVAVRSELSKFATAERFKPGVLGKVELGLEHGTFVRAIAPRLSLGHTATAPVVRLQTCIKCKFSSNSIKHHDFQTIFDEI